MKLPTHNSPTVVDDSCATRWPILLVHGVGFKQAEKLRLWGRIPETLKAHGARVFISNQDAWGSFESNARQLKAAVNRILEDQQAEKINIIAHSKGGIDARVLASMPDMRDHIASITTISSPHHGSKSLNWIPLAPDLLKRLVSTVADTFLILTGDDNPSFAFVCQNLSASSMLEFNGLFPIPDTIFVQSYSIVQKKLRTDLFFAPTLLVIRLVEGENDGLVAKNSAVFGNYQGEINESGSWGFSHVHIVDRILIPRQYHNLNRDGFDVRAWWVELVSNLKNLGY